MYHIAVSPLSLHSPLSSFSRLCSLSFLSLSLSLSSTPFVPAKLLPQVTIYSVLCYMYMYLPMYLMSIPSSMHNASNKMHSTNEVISYDSTSLSQASFRPALNKAEEFLDYSGSGWSANGFSSFSRHECSVLSDCSTYTSNDLPRSWLVNATICPRYYSILSIIPPSTFLSTCRPLGHVILYDHSVLFPHGEVYEGLSHAGGTGIAMNWQERQIHIEEPRGQLASFLQEKKWGCCCFCCSCTGNHFSCIADVFLTTPYDL